MNSIQDMIEEAKQAIQKTDNIIVEEMENKSTECVASIQADTPVGFGVLRRSMTHSEIKRLPDAWKVEIGSNISYCKPVEEGHKQEVGKYIPAIGKRLKKSFVPGKHMIRDNVDLYQEILNKSIQERIEREV